MGIFFNTIFHTFCGIIKFVHQLQQIMLLEHNGYTLENLPPDNLIHFTFEKKPLPEVVGYSTLQAVVLGAEPEVINANYIYRYALKKELLTEGLYLPLGYKTRDSGKIVLTHCGYEMILEQFYNLFVVPLALTEDSIKLMITKYSAYVGDRAEREAEQKLMVKLMELSELTGTPLATLQKQIVKK